MKYLLGILMLSPALVHAAEKPNILFIAIDDMNDWTVCWSSDFDTIMRSRPCRFGAEISVNLWPHDIRWTSTPVTTRGEKQALILAS